MKEDLSYVVVLRAGALKMICDLVHVSKILSASNLKSVFNESCTQCKHEIKRTNSTQPLMPPQFGNSLSL